MALSNIELLAHPVTPNDRLAPRGFNRCAEPVGRLASVRGASSRCDGSGEQEGKRLSRENLQLRSILKQFLDGVSVNEALFLPSLPFVCDCCLDGREADVSGCGTCSWWSQDVLAGPNPLLVVNGKAIFLQRLST